MAGADTQRHLLTLIRNFATEKSQGERRISGLKRRLEELRSALDLTNTDLENAKLCKENAEQELKGYEVELSMSRSSIQAQQARVSSMQDEIWKVKSDVSALEVFKLTTEKRVCRDEFIREMGEFKKMARKFLEKTACVPHEGISSNSSSDNGGEKVENKAMTNDRLAENTQKRHDTEVALKDLGDKIELITSQTQMVEQEYQENLKNQKKVQQNFVDLERTAFLIEAVVKETKELQELTRLLDLRRNALLLVQSYRGDVLVPVVIWTIWETWLELLKEVREVDIPRYY